MGFAGFTRDYGLIDAPRQAMRCSAVHIVTAPAAHGLRLQQLRVQCTIANRIKFAAPFRSFHYYQGALP
jgi:hypothetical protein